MYIRKLINRIPGRDVGDRHSRKWGARRRVTVVIREGHDKEARAEHFVDERATEIASVIHSGIGVEVRSAPRPVRRRPRACGAKLATNHLFRTPRKSRTFPAVSDLQSSLQATLSGAYTLERELGGGGMSRVFVADETRLGRKVVVKVLSPELAAGISAERFEREIRMAASLQQANIVPVLTTGESNGLPYYTMPFVEGESLRARLGKSGALPLAEAVAVLRDVARALAYAHDRGIVHRDIKPDNVLLSGGAAVVTDFGIAKALSDARTSVPGGTLTQLGTSIGTPAYISPEQAAGDPNVDHRADIYSFGCMGYELLTGRPPFADRTPQRLMAAHMSETPRPIVELRPDLPESISSMVMRCLEKEPSARPQSAAEIVAALDATPVSGASHPAMAGVLLGGRGMLRRALGVYAASFVAVAVLAKAAIVGVGLPDWVFPGALIVMALGLPVILFTAYTQYVARRAATATPTYTPGGGTAQTTHGTMAAIAIKASPHMSWRRAMFGGLYAVGGFALVIGAFMLLRAFGVGPAGSLLASGRFSTKAPVLIADFVTTNTDSSLGTVVSDAVRAGLGQSSVISLVRTADVAATLRLMRRPPTSRLDLPLAREVAQRNGVQAIVDGKVTGVPGGYIIALRLVNADSGTELASFRETGDGPRGLIDASDKLARALRGKIGESLREVQSTPPLAQVTTSSLEALRAYSLGSRANNAENDPLKAVRYWREATRLDTSFATAWVGLAVGMGNAEMPQAGIDSALEHGYRDRDRLAEAERQRVVAVYAASGPHRDRTRSAALFADMARTGARRGSALVNAGEAMRSWRDFAAAESLNLAAVQLDSLNAVALLNVVQLELDRGRPDSAAKTLAVIRRRMPDDRAIGVMESWIAYGKGDMRRVQQLTDSLTDPAYRQRQKSVAASLAAVHGQLAQAGRFIQEASRADSAHPQRYLRDSLALAAADAWFHGPNERDAARLDAALARYPMRNIAMVDRPYFDAITGYARAGKVDRARSVLAAYRADVTDTATLRLQAAELHNALGEIALAANDPRTALAEFRRGDVGYDGKPAAECAACTDFKLARAFDAAAMPDSAIAAYERFINTPYWNRLAEADALGLAGSHKRLGELYEAKGDATRAIPHYEKFVELWKNADPELQTHVADVKRRLTRLMASEKR
ncbi:MAG: protein kinase [Gemmatimonadetes bacterium]|nr:protein kinase [Gemmatimonadota bacterium]